ncbi:ATP-binding protein [Streptomyces sp. NPDC056683]|uniref:ATP-binding protein n=1 Tax=Streptomyces sp. NPDC056683 TaxID=3345910 RepID=UPI0036C6F61A
MFSSVSTSERRRGTPEPPGPPSGEDRLPGRGAELELIDSLHAGPGRGSSGLLLHGEPGVGKTALLDAAATPGHGSRDAGAARRRRAAPERAAAGRAAGRMSSSRMSRMTDLTWPSRRRPSCPSSRFPGPGCESAPRHLPSTMIVELVTGRVYGS